MNMTHPDILETERHGMPENRYCYCGNMIYDNSKFCESCQNEYNNQRDDIAEEKRLFS